MYLNLSENEHEITIYSEIFIIFMKPQNNTTFPK